jgi:hypothetical protein
MTRHIICSAAVIIALFLFPQRMACAQDAAPIETGRPAGNIGYQPITDEDIQLMRKDIRSQRKQIIAANMKLNDAEAEKFWPVYNQYIADLSKINDAKYALIKQYVQNRGVLTAPGGRFLYFGYQSSKRTSMPDPSNAFWKTVRSDPR